MKMFGHEARFAWGFELRSDPDEGGDPAERASWGALQVWVTSRNLTAGRAEGVALEAAEIPLLPVVRWLVERWDSLLVDEGRFPCPKEAGSAASWRMSCFASLDDDEVELDRLLEDRDARWHRHGLGSALPEYRVPDVHIRRVGMQAEVSWDDREWRTVSCGVRLIESSGAVLLPVGEIARVLFDWASAVVAELHQVSAARTIADELERRLERIERGTL